MATVLPIAHDPGNGTTSTASFGRVSSLQSSVVQLTTRQLEKYLSDTEGRKRKPADPTLVQFDGLAFLCGNHVWEYAPPANLVGSNIYHTSFRLALLYATLVGLTHDDGSPMLAPELAPESTEVALMIALPRHVTKNPQLKKATSEGLATLKGNHSFRVNGSEYAFSIPNMKGSIRTTSQPRAAHSDYFFDAKLKPIPSRMGDVLVLDIGAGSFDSAWLIVDEQGNLREAEGFTVDGENLGTQWVINKIVDETGLYFEEVDYAIRSRKMKVNDRLMTDYLSAIIKATNRATQSELQRFHRVLAVGGGTYMMGQMLATELLAQRGRVYIPDNPLETIALGADKQNRLPR